MKSKMNAMKTIAMTYGITRRDASRVLQRNALEHLGDAHAAVGRALERVVHLFPFQDVERVRVPGEQSANGFVVDRVRLFLQLLDMRRLLADELGLTDRRDTGLNVLRRVNEHLCKLSRGRLHHADVKHLEAACRPVQPVDYAIVSRCERV